MKNKGSYILALLVALAFCLANSTVFAGQLVIPGTGANEVILQELAAAFNAENPGDEVVIPPSVGSGGGIRLVGNGEYNLGRVARTFKDEELQHNLQYLPFARDMIVFVVGGRVGVKNLSSQQLAEVFSGKIKNWQEVGGNDTRIRLLVRGPNDSLHVIIRKNLESFENITFSNKAKVLFHDYEMVNALNKYSTATGWLTNSSMKNIDSSAKAISIDNIPPTQENVYDGKYAISVDYALVYKKEKLDELARKFVNYVFSKKGNKILVNNGLVPVNRQQH